jgi:hypothetical protein
MTAVIGSAFAAFATDGKTSYSFTFDHWTLAVTLGDSE